MVAELRSDGHGKILTLPVAVMLTIASVAFAQETRQLWAYKVDGFVTRSSPALSADGSTIFVGVERDLAGRSGLLAVTSAGGDKWKAILPRPVESTPALSADGTTIYVGCSDGKLYAFNSANGEKRWELNTSSLISSSPAIGADGTIYVGAWNFRLYAVAPNGHERWSYPTDGMIDLSSPAIGADGTIYVGSNDKSLHAITPHGEKKWQHPTGGPIIGSPAIGVDGTVYIGSSDQKMYAVAPDGTKKWEFFTNGDIQSSPVLGADGTVYFASNDNYFYALNWTGSDDERLKWKTPIHASTASTAAVRGDGVIIFATDDGKVHFLNGSDGSVRPLFETMTRDFIESSPIVAPDGSIYIGSSSGMLYKIGGNGSPLSAYSPWPAFRRDTAHTGRALMPIGDSHLINLSTRAQSVVGTSLIAGFFVDGVGAKAFLMRGIGPSLASFGIAGFLNDPRLRVLAGDREESSNDNWEDIGSGLSSGFSVADSAAAVGAFPLLAGSKDAAVVPVLKPGLYTVHVESVNGASGVSLVEAYELPGAEGGERTTRLLNLSTRGQVGQGEDNLIAGVTVGGPGRTRLLVRAIGLGLEQFGVRGVLARPTMAVFSGTQMLRSNTGWTSDGFKGDLIAAAQSVQAFSLSEGSTDCATILDATAGSYTIRVSGAGGSTGEALVEIYVLP